MNSFINKINKLFDLKVLLWSFFVSLTFIFLGIILWKLGIRPISNAGFLLFWIISLDIPLYLFMFLYNRMTIERRRKVFILIELEFTLLVNLNQYLNSSSFDLFLSFLAIHVVIDQLTNYNYFLESKSR
ncbi:MAG: hypothetical protein C4537_04785 [Acholeplasma sp.]|jgi:hypothetical protein|nr:MAG: hypothetical protein C4537_04785 [Acholeplasma sp.]